MEEEEDGEGLGIVDTSFLKGRTSMEKEKGEMRDQVKK